MTNPSREEQLEAIKKAHEAGYNKFLNGANEDNCNFRHFATPEQTKAWEQGAAGKQLEIEIITIQSTREQQLEAIRGKCIEANEEIETRTIHFQVLHIPDRKVRLADILLAITDPHDPKLYICNVSEVMKLIANWNLRKDDITLQEDSTIQFIFNLFS